MNFTEKEVNASSHGETVLAEKLNLSNYAASILHAVLGKQLLRKVHYIDLRLVSIQRLMAVGADANLYVL